MRINYRSVPEYRLWRQGTNKVAGSKGRPGTKIKKKMLREAIKSSYRAQRMAKTKGGAD